MTTTSRVKSAMGAAAGVFGLAAAAYAACAGTAWWRYGRPPAPSPEDHDEVLDRFMPVYDIVERHHVPVDAPADVTYAAATELDLEDSVIIRAIFRARELALGAEEVPSPDGGLVKVTTALGWRVLTEIPGREIVLGAVTQPWIANPVFRGVAPEEFEKFSEPRYVKIVWTLRADPVGPAHSIVRSETRAVATDASAREAFRRYWAYVSPGIWTIREIGMRLVKRNAEARDWRAAARTA